MVNKMIYNFDNFPDRKITESIKWRKFPDDVLPMWVADMDFVSPEPVIRALRARVEHGVFGYPQEPPELRELIVARMAECYHWHIHPEDIVFLPGVVCGFNLACHSVARQGTDILPGVLVQPPVYPPFLGAPAYAGLTRQDAELVYNVHGSYAIDWESFEGAITGQTRLFLLCNPHNPVGRVFRQDELARMAEICLRRGVLICSDEIHCDLVYPGHTHIPIASVDSEIAQHTITLIAPSKTFNIAGLECSYAIIQNAEIRKRYQEAKVGLVSGVNLMGWVAALAALRDGQDWLDQLLVYLQANRDYLYDTLKNEIPSIKMVRPEGTYLAWLDCRETGIENPYEFFLNQARVALFPGNLFGPGGTGFVRLNFGCPRPMLAEALQRMKKALED